MNNIFRKLSQMGGTLMSNMSKSGNIMNNVRKSVGILTVATAASMGSGVMAGDQNNVGKSAGALTVATAVPISSNTMTGEWHIVDTRGIGPEAFCMQKFGNGEWWRLRDRLGRGIPNPNKDLNFKGEYTQIPAASGQGDTTAKSAARIVSTPRPQPKPEARINIVSIGEKSEGNIKEKNDAQTNSLKTDTDLNKNNVPKKEFAIPFEIPSDFDSVEFFAEKTAEKTIFQNDQIKSDLSTNGAPICENPDTMKNSRIMEIPSDLNITELFASRKPKNIPQYTRMEPKFSGNVTSIQQARALRKPLDNITAKESSEQPIAIKNQSFLKKLLTRIGIGKLIRAIRKIESNGSRTARNDKACQKLKKDINQCAFGADQFTIGTLKTHGTDLTENGKISEPRVRAFLGNPTKQDSIMLENLERNSKVIVLNPKLMEAIEKEEISPIALLAQGHFAGPGSIGKKPQGKDYFGKPVLTYMRNIVKLVNPDKKEESIIDTTASKSTNSKKSTPNIQAIQPEFKMPTPTIQESKELIKPEIQAIGPESQEISSLMPAPELEEVNNTMTSANDTIFVTKYATNSVISNIEDKRIQKNIREKLEQFDSEIEGLMAIEDNHRKKAMELQIQADNIIGANSKFTQLKMIEKAKKEIIIANGIRKVIMTMSKAKKAA